MTVRRKTGSVYALGMRLVQLTSTGAPVVGPLGAYVTDNLVRVDFTMTYTEGEVKERTNGAGRHCLRYEAPSRVSGIEINALELCNPDPELESIIDGGTILVDEDDDTVGYAAPEVGADSTGHGFAMELWSNAVHDEGPDDDYPYMRWLFPRERVRATETRSVGPDPMAASFAGSGRQNANYGNGPFNDWPYISSRVYQWYRCAELPDLAVNDFVTVPVDGVTVPLV